MEQFIQNISLTAPYAAVGAILAASITYLQFRLVTKERRHREELLRRRQEKLRKMNEIKDRRIDELHEEIARLQQRLSRAKEFSDE